MLYYIKSLGPLFIQIAGAILCLLCSSIFHLFSAYSPKVQSFLSRLDYGGISFLICGSTFPPVLYGFACTTYIKWIYLSVIGSLCLLAFISTLIPGGELPKYRKIRAFVYIGAGLSAGIPAFHAAISS